MTRLLLAVVFAAFVPAGARPQSSKSDLEAFLKLRQQHGIERPASREAIEQLEGPKIIEIRGIARGKVQINGRLTALFDGTVGSWIATSIPENLSHLTKRDTNARFIVRMRKTPRGLEAEILGGVHESEISRWEVENPSHKTIAPSPLSNPLDSLAPKESINLTDGLIYYYSDFVIRQNVSLSVDTANLIAKEIIEASKRVGLDARLVTAVIWSRSNFTPDFVSAGRFGLGGLTRNWCNRYGITNPFDIADNVVATCKRLRSYFESFIETKADGSRGPNIALALAAFDAGAAAVRRYKGVPPYKSTREFVITVSERYKALTGHK